ncbi:MAG TPA: hypothetical protein PLL26_06655 [Candidatus Dojkabacteria bacterium]|nr:hypothetical protein [Candidatus Dojkabacteria bacterium]
MNKFKRADIDILGKDAIMPQISLPSFPSQGAEVRVSTVSEQLRKLQNKIENDAANATGVFIIHSKADDMIFVGSASRSFKSKWAEHNSLLRRNMHGTWMLQWLYHRYGIDNFSYYMIEVCPPEDCLKRKNYYVNLLEPEINFGIPPDTKSHGLQLREEIERLWKEWEKTEEGKQYRKNTIGKKRAKWAKTKVGRATIREDMRNLRDNLNKTNLSEEEKIEKLLEYNEYFPEKPFNNEEIRNFINKSRTKGRDKSYTEPKGEGGNHISSKFVIPSKPVEINKTPHIKKTESQKHRIEYDKRIETTKYKNHKSKAQLKREAKEQINNTMGCVWLVIIILIIWFLIWFF